MDDDTEIDDDFLRNDTGSESGHNNEVSKLTYSLSYKI